MRSAKIHLGGTARSPEDVRALSNLGLRFAEIPIRQPEEFLPILPTYQRLKKETGLYYVGHGAQEGDPNDIKSLERVYLPKLMQILSIVSELGMRLLTVHLWFDSRFVTQEAIGYKIALLQQITEKAAPSQLTITVENLSENADDMAGVFQAVPLLGLTLDLGHAQLLTDENTSFGFMERLPDRIKHIHLHDNFGGDSPEDDLHLPVGEGTIDFARIFAKLKAMGYQRTITMELKPPEIRKNLDYVKRLLDS